MTAQAGQKLNDYLGDSCRMVGNRADLAYGCNSRGIAVSMNMPETSLRAPFFNAVANIAAPAVQPQQPFLQPAPQLTIDSFT